MKQELYYGTIFLKKVSQICELGRAVHGVAFLGEIEATCSHL